MLSHSPGCSALLWELSGCLFVVFSGLYSSDSAVIPDSFKTGALPVSTSVMVVLSKVMGSLPFVRAVLAIELRMQMTAVRFISFKKMPKFLTVAFSNEHPPHKQVIWIRNISD